MPSDSLYSLPLEQQVGQFFYIGLPGLELDAQTRELLEEVKPGGVIIFGRNVASAQQLRDLLDGVRELLPTEPLLGIDQEGGLVDRLRRIFTPMPSARTCYELGQSIARVLKDRPEKVAIMASGGLSHDPETPRRLRSPRSGHERTVSADQGR